MGFFRSWDWRYRICMEFIRNFADGCRAQGKPVPGAVISVSLSRKAVPTVRSQDGTGQNFGMVVFSMSRDGRPGIAAPVYR